MPAKDRDYKPLTNAEGFRLLARARDAEIKCKHLEEICAALLAQLVKEMTAREVAERRAASLDKRVHDLIHGREPKVYRNPSLRQGALPVRGQEVQQGARVA